MNKKQLKEVPSEFEIRSMAMKLAIQHSRNCQASTLVKLANTIYDFLTGKKTKFDSDN